jgi:hypothetical protein
MPFSRSGRLDSKESDRNRCFDSHSIVDVAFRNDYFVRPMGFWAAGLPWSRGLDGASAEPTRSLWRKRVSWSWSMNVAASLTW